LYYVSMPPLVFVLLGLSTSCFGLYPSITALLTTEVPLQVQGQLQGSLFALTTLGSVVALGLYLAVYTYINPSAIWYLNALLAAAASANTLLGGDGNIEDEALSAHNKPPDAVPAAPAYKS
jgi:hypothetical protein